MGFDIATYSFLKSYVDKNGSGFSYIQVSPDGATINFTSSDGQTFPISIGDWNALTRIDKEKISKLIIDGSGDKVLYNDGIYRTIPKTTITDYENLDNKPSINDVILEGNKNALQLGFSKVSISGSYKDLSDTPDNPIFISQLINDSGFITDTVDNLINYYTKSETYNKTEVNELLNGLSSIDFKVVVSLPTSGISTTTVYLIRVGNTNSYVQWMYLNGTWSNIGSTEVDLTEYYNKTQVSSLLSTKVDKKIGYGLSQKNYTPDEKTKLAGLQNFVPPIVSNTAPGMLMVDGITIVADENGVISLAEGSGLAPGNVSNLCIEEASGELIIKWEDPGDTIIEGQVLSQWKGTRLVCKVGEYPKTPTDGTVAVDNTIRNSYSEDGYRLTGLVNGITYYIQLFSYSNTNAINKSEDNRICGTPVLNEKIMTVVIDTANSNPSTSVTYEDDALTMTPGSNDWDNWFGMYPCLFKDGQEVGKLNPDNFEQFTNGSPADITTGNSGDVMICFPIRGLKIETIGTKIYIKMTDNINNPDFKYYAHQRGAIKKDKFYLSAYRLDANGYSISGVLSEGNIALNSWREIIHRFGSGYDVGAFYQLVFRQSMYILKYKNLNSQDAVGYGESTASTNLVNGETNKSGMNFGGINPKDGKSKMKLFGLEDFWGRKSEFIDGCFINASRTLLTATENFNNTGSGYQSWGSIPWYTGIGFMSKARGNTEGGFIPTGIGASSSTYYCDYGMVSGSSLCFYGGYYQNVLNNGIFCQLFNSSGLADAGIGARKMYL